MGLDLIQGEHPADTRKRIQAENQRLVLALECVGKGRVPSVVSIKEYVKQVLPGGG